MPKLPQEQLLPWWWAGVKRVGGVELGLHDRLSLQVQVSGGLLVHMLQSVITISFAMLSLFFGAGSFFASVLLGFKGCTIHNASATEQEQSMQPMSSRPPPEQDSQFRILQVSEGATSTHQSIMCPVSTLSEGVTVSTPNITPPEGASIHSFIFFCTIKARGLFIPWHLLERECKGRQRKYYMYWQLEVRVLLCVWKYSVSKCRTTKLYVLVKSKS